MYKNNIIYKRYIKYAIDLKSESFLCNGIKGVRCYMWDSIQQDLNNSQDKA
jgi:hypothetical protein